jgi:hypothetical protein
MNQRVVLFLLNLYSKGQAIYHETISKKLPSQLSWFNQNRLASLQFDLVPTYQNSTRRSVSSTYLFYKIERNMMVILYKLAESLEFVTAKRYQNSTKVSNLVLFKLICQTMPKTACFAKELKTIS